METRVRPRPFWISGANKKVLTLPVMPVFADVPAGAPFRLDYIFVAYNDVVVANAQTSRDLDFMLFDSRGVSLTGEVPVPIKNYCPPSGNLDLRAFPKWGIVYPAKTVIRMEISGQVGTGPETISVTFAGKKADGGR